MKSFSELYESLWANIHKKRQRIKQGSGEKMRKVGDKGAPTRAQMKRAKGEQMYDRVGNVKIMKPILVKPKPLGTPPKLGGQTKRGYKVIARPPRLPESEVQDTKDNHRRQNQARRQKQQQELETAARIDARNKQREQEKKERNKQRQTKT
tara:strand:+ start:982 stop:1434 length:453 start_codon:yes stop_codon:yes gene_type:complete